MLAARALLSQRQRLLASSKQQLKRSFAADAAQSSSGGGGGGGGITILLLGGVAAGGYYCYSQGYMDELIVRLSCLLRRTKRIRAPGSGELELEKRGGGVDQLKNLAGD